MAPTLRSVTRLDSLPLNQTYFTPEGYLIDRPILTRTGIFEYQNKDGSIRRELRLPEDVFDVESLKSYKGKPVIISHDAGLVTKDNVQKHEVGTILSEGYRSNDSVRAEVVIHRYDDVKKSGFKELSLGYNLELDETPGEWNGQPYDAVQHNIRVNHLALVQEARAGEKARLNIDSRDRKKSNKEENGMKNHTKQATRADGTLSPEEFQKAIDDYKARRAQRIAAKADAEKPAAEPEVVSTEPAQEPTNVPAAEDGIAPDAGVDKEPVAENPEQKLQMVKDRRDIRDTDGDPESQEACMGVIAQQDEDMGILFDIIDTLLAKAEFDAAGNESVAVEPEKEVEGEEGVEPENEDGKKCDAKNCDGNNEAIPAVTPAEVKPAINADSVDAIVRQRIQLGLMGRKLNMDCLEDMGIMDAKKAIITAVRPSLRLDGKSSAFVDAAYELAVSDVKAGEAKGTDYQKQQMFNKDSRSQAGKEDGSSVSARQRMIDRQHNKKEEK